MNKKIFLMSLILIIVIAGGILFYITTKHNPNIQENKINLSGLILDDVVNANNQFGLDLYSRYNAKNENIFFSPYSISSALAMTYEGAKGKTAEEMQAVLHLPNDKEKIHSSFLKINNEINKANKEYNLSVANSLWAQKEYPFEKNYFDVVNTYYSGKVTNLDFKKDTENSRITINNWVESKTNNKIKEILSPGILTPDTKLVLTNAIYFKANWSNQFFEDNTKESQFKLNNGNTVKANIMHQASHFNYSETNNLQILEMDYIGNDISMLVILPKGNNLDQVEKEFSQEKLNEWKNNMQPMEVALSLPKFKFEETYQMKDDLAQMGMPTAFTSDANFSGISSTNQLSISQVIHKTFIDVTESGTEAAAATAVVMLTTGMPERPKIFNADHPFIFIIQEKKTGNILFIGRLNDPTQ